MRIIDAPLAVLRFQYRIVRMPLQLIEQNVFARMGAEAPARLFYERSLGLMDAAVGSALGDPRLAERGDALAERSDALRHAADLDDAAKAAREQSRSDLKAKSDKAIDEQRNARTEAKREVEDAKSTAAEEKRAAEEAAAKRTASAKEKADDAAAQRVKAAEAARRDEQARIRAGEEKAAAAAKSKLDDAQDKRTEADMKRTQADRVEELVDVEKQKRQTERAE
ncbi:IF2 family translation initiation factor [Mycolicibacterium pyrenivorans]|uniref:IF2 family translation initiation factor n=1 Tax=Mycolicibacterium pyrenivorans TaxID=187102 RepID=UPI0021F3B62E|nr:IF2 family translation initiation factor [Mycolicibacterium pyrenivorans]MCV7153782.1 IF2 family translation initiation factor [Mycolicibacterium pyrenivorans]